MAKDNKKTQSSTGSTNNVGRPTGSYSSYGTSGYNGSSYSSYSRATYSTRVPSGVNGTSNQQPQVANQANVAPNSDNKSKKENMKTETKIEKVDLPADGKMTRKQKKLAKKSAKFDDTDLRNYPMTVGSWIGTLILLAIPIVGGICAICWFFGVGNKSRTAWARAYVVIWLIIILLICTILGVSYAILSKKAQDAGAPKSIQGTLYYVACEIIDMFADQIGDADAVRSLKDEIASKLGISSGKPANPEGGTSGTGGTGGTGGTETGTAGGELD